MKAVLVIDGSYAEIGADRMGGTINYIKFRENLESKVGSSFLECWFYDHYKTQHATETFSQRQVSETWKYQKLKLVPPDGPQVSISIGHDIANVVVSIEFV